MKTAKTTCSVADAANDLAPPARTAAPTGESRGTAALLTGEKEEAAGRKERVIECENTILYDDDKNESQWVELVESWSSGLRASFVRMMSLPLIASCAGDKGGFGGG